jgi:transcriptional regulator with GAF, ATPase, and Fis domain
MRNAYSYTSSRRSLSAVPANASPQHGARTALVAIQEELQVLTGHGLVGQAIHFHSRRTKRPFIKVNCAALTETLLKSELFGHKKGAFTGAIQDRKGRFTLADGGTILLDEIDSLSRAGQAKLLRVLQEKEFERVGDSTTVQVDVRVIAITNTDFVQAMQAGPAFVTQTPAHTTIMSF